MAEYKICFSVAGAFGAQISFEAKPGVSYEDTERTPEEVTALGKLFDYALKESKTLTEQLALLNRIRDLAKADRDGRLVAMAEEV